jgi:putative endonuclease
MQEIAGYVYILASRIGGTLYIGVTSDLVKRVFEHKSGTVEGFTKTYKVHRLVYFELHDSIEAAIQRERQMKKWNRKWKIELIQGLNPDWVDLSPSIASIVSTGSPLSRG